MRQNGNVANEAVPRVIPGLCVSPRLARLPFWERGKDNPADLSVKSLAILRAKLSSRRQRDPISEYCYAGLFPAFWQNEAKLFQ
jgi:hypothetical protein